jgi:Transcriptional regulator
MRDIAERLKMSPGNLTYHFKKKNDILYGIIQLLVSEHKNHHYSAEVTLAEFNSTLMSVIEHQKRYAFYYRNITELKKKYPWISKLQMDYKKEFYHLISDIFHYFEACHWIKPESSKNQYNDLSVAVLAVTTFWSQLNFDEKIWNLNSVVWSIILPTLTEKGMSEFQCCIR